MLKNFLPREFTPQQKNYLIWFIAAAGLLLRIGYLYELAGEVHGTFAIGPDVQEYHERALEIISGKFFPDQPEIHAPLYSIFLSLIYRLSDASVMAARSVQILLNWAALILLGKLIRRQGASFGMECAFLFFGMFTPVMFFHHGELISESLILPLLTGVLWSFYYAKGKLFWYLTAGLAIGLMILTHGLLLFFALAELLYHIFRRQYRAAGLLTAGIALAVTPFIFAKSVHYGRFSGVQANSFYNLWIGNNPDATGGCYLRPGKSWSQPLENVRMEAAASGTGENVIFCRKIVSFMAEYPGRAILLPVRKTALLLSPGEPIAGADPEMLIRCTAIQKYGKGMMAVLLVLSLCGIFFAVKYKESLYIHFYLLGGGLCFALLLTVVSGRYRSGLFSALAVLAAIAVCRLGKKALLPAAAAFIVGSWWISPADNAAEAFSIRGEAYYRQKNFAEAERLLKMAEKAIDDPSRFDNMLGAIAEENGDIAEAEKRYIKAITGAPANAEAYLNLAHLYFYNAPEKRREALLLIGEALKRKPDMPSAYDMLGVDLVQKQDLPAALEMFEKASELAPDNELYRKKVDVCREVIKKGIPVNAH